MMRFGVLSALVAVLAPAAASAQTRAGVPLASILGEGERVLSVEAPDAWELPARVRLSCGEAPGACARIDVWVCESEAAAEVRLAAVLATSTTTELDERPGLAERARADAEAGRASIVIGRRENVVFAVRALTEAADAAAVAGRIDAATLAAGAGDARATRASSAAAEAVLRDPGEGGALTLAAPPGVLDVEITATGAARARRAPAGWLVSRELGSFELFAWFVDDHLRVGNVSLSWDPDATETIRHPLGR